jgi:hypothetical protein
LPQSLLRFLFQAGFWEYGPLWGREPEAKLLLALVVFFIFKGKLSLGSQVGWL